MRTAFGRFVFDEEQRLLLDNGDPVHLTTKAVELLRLLLYERPRVIPKDELHARLWRDTFVSDATLAGLVKELRAALGGASGNATAIRTVHGFGYAFSMECTEAAPATSFRPAAGVRCCLHTADRRFELRAGDNVIGRGADAAEPLEAAGVSRRHARVVVTATGTTIEDLGSKNGTQVKGRRIGAPTRLEDRDEVRIGPLVLVFRIYEPDSTTRTID
jgi:DNA-binding winged helix-turn-helix (wHTH) protein